MFSSKAFQDWGKQDVVLFAAVMTKIEGREDDDLLRTYGFRGFPSLALIDDEGEMVTKKIGRDLYSMQTVSAAIPAYNKLKPKVEAGDDVDKAAWFMARLGMGELNLEDAKSELEGLKLDAHQTKSATTQIFVMELTGLSRNRSVQMDEKAGSVYSSYKAGKRLPAGAALEPFFDQMLVKGASAEKDSKAFFFAYDRVKKVLSKQLKTLEERKLQYKDNQRAQEYFDRNIKSTKKQIDELESQAKALKG